MTSQRSRMPRPVMLRTLSRQATTIAAAAIPISQPDSAKPESTGVR